LELFEAAQRENVAFVPGNAFYVDGGGSNALRLNFSNSDAGKIEEGIKRLAKVIKKLLKEHK
jgi:2-aminoadipate transaminase